MDSQISKLASHGGNQLVAIEAECAFHQFLAVTVDNDFSGFRVG